MDNVSYKRMNRRLLPLMMAFSVGISQVPFAFAGPGDINSTNVGTVVQDGTYYNTNGNQTTFVGQNGLLWVQSGTEVRGLEVNGSGALTGNGGNMLFTNPGGMIRVDGTVNASGIMGAGYATSNGGMVTLRADYINVGSTGQIFAMGTNGGIVNVDAGALTMAPGSVMSVAGLGGAGGAININASSSVDIQRNGNQAALIDASGKYMGTIDTSVINIQGAVVNNEGVVRANGYVVADGNIVHLYNENVQQPDGTLVAKLPAEVLPTEGTLMTTGSEGGTIRVVATGAGTGENNGICIAECAIQKAEAYNPESFGPGEAQNIINNMRSLADQHNGDINVGPQGVFQANGSSVNFLANGELLVDGQPVVDKGYGHYEQAFNEGGIDGVIDAITDKGEGSANFFKGQDGGVILMNARNDVNVQGGTVDGVTTGGLIAARGGNGNGYSYTTGEGLGSIQFQTFDGGDGGFVSVNAQRDINFEGSVHAFGGAGYRNFRDLTPAEQLLLTNKNLPENYIFDNQDMALGGLGGNGGAIAFSYGRNFNNTFVSSLNGFYLAPSFLDKTLANFHQIDASGGHSGFKASGFIDGQINPYGGLVVFSGESNPDNLQNVSVYRGQGPDLYPIIDTSRFGTVVLPDAVTPTAISQLKDSNTNFNPDATPLKIEQLQSDELIVGRDTIVLLSNSNIGSLWGKVNNAVVRSADPNFQAGGGGVLLQGADANIKNIVINSMEDGDFDMDIPGPLEGSAHWLANAGNTDFSNLSALMVMSSKRGEGAANLINNNFWLAGGSAVPAGGFISLMSDGNIVNNNVLAVTSEGGNFDGTISLAANGSIINNGYIGGTGGSLQGASVILKACRDILNNGEWDGDQFLGGEIGANGYLNGGRIELLANNNILNLGKIYTDGLAFGGKVLSYAGNNNYNFGLITANGYGFGENENAVGVGGYIHQHGRNLSANIDLNTLLNDPEEAAGFGPGRIEAAGTMQGGKVFISAGSESCGVGCANDNPTETVTGASDDVNGLLTELVAQDNLAGFSTTQNTPPVTVMDTFIDMTRSGSALNLGHIETRSFSENGGGETWLVGQGQVGVGDGSSINGVQVAFNDILDNANPPAAFQSLMTGMNDGGNSVKLVAGNVGDVSALSAVFCSDLVPPGTTTGDTPEDGGGYDFPNNFTIPGPDTPPDTSFDINGLFQDYRFRNDPTIPRPPAALVLSFQNPGMFLAKAYQPVTQEILRLAFLEYNRALADADFGSATQGVQTHKRAFEMARLYLSEAGVDQDTAQALLKSIEDGTFNADKNIVGVLQALANPEIEPTSTPATPTTTPEEPTNVLRQ